MLKLIDLFRFFVVRFSYLTLLRADRCLAYHGVHFSTTLFRLFTILTLRYLCDTPEFLL